MLIGSWCGCRRRASGQPVGVVPLVRRRRTRPTRWPAAPRRTRPAGRPCPARPRPGRGCGTCTACPGAASGTNSSHTPLGPSERIGQPSCGAPAGEVADHPHAARVGRPDRERHARRRGRRAPSAVPQSLVPALADQVQVQLAQRGRVPVRVVAQPRRRPRSGSRAPSPGTVASKTPSSCTRRHRVPLVADDARSPRRRPGAGCGWSCARRPGARRARACGSCAAPAISWSIGVVLEPSGGGAPERRHVASGRRPACRTGAGRRTVNTCAGCRYGSRCTALCCPQS